MHKGYGGGKKKSKRKSYGESHMDSGMSYKGVPQGYYDPGGKPMGEYGKARNGYIDQTGMPNASQTRKALEHMSGYYGKNTGVMSDTNAGTTPNVNMVKIGRGSFR